MRESEGESEGKCESMGVVFAIVKMKIHEVHVRGWVGRG